MRSRYILKNSLLGCTLLGCLISCVRYVPSRSEISESQPKNSPSKSELLGAEAFKAHEQELKDRVSKLVSARNTLAVGPSQDTYRLGAGDILDFDVFSFDNLKSEIEIAPNGTASFPLIDGNISAENKTLFELKESVRARLKRFILNPQIRLSVKEYRAHRVAVTGEVAKPGLYPLKREAPLVAELIAEAGGRTDKASTRVLILPTSHAANALPGIEIDFEDLIGSASASPVMIPVVGGDTIIVPEIGTYEVEGEVDKPGSYKITGKKSLMGAIAAAGGVGFAAKVGEVEVIRDIGAGKKAYMAFNLEDIALKGLDDLRIRDGDLIRVPTQSGRHIQRQVVEAINSIFRGVGVQGRVN